MTEVTKLAGWEKQDGSQCSIGAIPQAAQSAFRRLSSPTPHLDPVVQSRLINQTLTVTAVRFSRENLQRDGLPLSL